MRQLRSILLVLALVICGVVYLTMPKPQRARDDDAIVLKPTPSVTFKLRSPLSDPATLAKRLSIDAAPDYDITTLPFFVYVPPTYTSAKPMGLMVLLNYKPTTEFPTPVLQQFGEANLALVISKDYPEPWQHRAGLALDAVFNMQKQYAIDPRRIYIMGGGEPIDAPFHNTLIPARLGLNYPEVFRGTISMGVPSYTFAYLPNGRYYNPVIPTPAAAHLSLARERPLIVSYQEDADSEGWHLMASTFAKDGFKHALIKPLTMQQYHYPNYTSDWLPGMIAFFDQVNVGGPVTAPTTRPMMP